VSQQRKIVIIAGPNGAPVPDRRGSQPMSNSLKSNLDDADMQAAPRALLRSAQRAREVARQHGTGIIVVRDGVVVEETPTDLDLGRRLRWSAAALPPLCFCAGGALRAL